MILLSGLLLAQLTSILLQFEDRGQRLFQSSGTQIVERIAEIVRLFDKEDKGNDKTGCDSGCVTPESIINNIGWPNPPAFSADSPSAEFRNRLQGLLGECYPLQVVVSDQPMAKTQHADLRHMMHMENVGMTLPEAMVFFARVQLDDGTWVTFENRIDDEILPTQQRY